jgi:SAM-dependent methyltransferase
VTSPGLSSELYDRDYFLSEYCEGWERFRADRGLSPLKTRELELLDVAPGHHVLDAGCGRGEVLLACAGRGAAVAGIDYADAAVGLSRETLAEVEGADVRHGDLTALPWPPGTFDRALLGDVIEHLTPRQAATALLELRRVLRPGGRLVVHTAPNRAFLALGWPVARVALKLTGGGATVEQVDWWIAESKRFHVNEQTVWSLGRGLRAAGFATVRAWVDADVARGGDHHLTGGLGAGAAGSAARAAGVWPLRLVFGNDLYAVGTA